MKKILRHVSQILILLILAACKQNSVSSGEDTGSVTGAEKLGIENTSYNAVISQINETTELPQLIYDWTNSYSANTSSRNLVTEKSPDDINCLNEIYLNISDGSISADNIDYKSLSESKTTVIENLTAKIKGGLITITDTNEGNLKICVTGSSSSSAIKINSTAENSIVIELKEVSLNSGNYPCIEVKNENTIYLVCEGSNTLTDGRTFGTGYSEAEGTDYYTSSYSGTPDSDAVLTAAWEEGSDKKGSIYTKGPLILSGTGSLSLSENYKHGFYSKDYIQINGGTYNVQSTGRNAFQAVNSFILNNGSVTISGTGTHTNNQSRGIIVEGSEDTPGEGYILINGGSINSTTVSKGISAKWDIDEDAETSSTSDDPYPFILISGGSITLNTTGTPMDESSSYYSFIDADGVTVSEKTKLSPEGIEGKQAVFITGGSLELNCTDDCINASNDTSGKAARLEIYGGNIYAFSSENDAIDSNGTLTIAGGIIVAATSRTPECAFDCDSNTFSITGGLIAGIGTNNYSKPTESSCSQSTLVLSGNYFGCGKSTFALEDSSENPVFVYTIPEEFGTTSNSNYIMICSSPLIKTGTSYTAVTGISAEGGTTFHDLYIEMPTVSDGSSTLSNISTSSSSYVYTKTSSTNGGAQEGSHPNSGPNFR